MSGISCTRCWIVTDLQGCRLGAITKHTVYYLLPRKANKYLFTNNIFNRIFFHTTCKKLWISSTGQKRIWVHPYFESVTLSYTLCEFLNLHFNESKNERLFSPGFYNPGTCSAASIYCKTTKLLPHFHIWLCVNFLTLFLDTKPIL